MDEPIQQTRTYPPYNDDNLISKIHAHIRLTSITTSVQAPFFYFQWTIPRTSQYAR